jgi:pimeloyl-ACP methyl ester carboxylesterase
MSRELRLMRLVTLVVALGLGCVGTANASAPPAVDWTPCADATGFDCAEVEAPLDYDAPSDGRTVTLAVIRHAADGPDGRLGTVFFNPGGPGGAGTQFLPAWIDLFPAEVRQRFDLVSWDPRGVGESTAAQCFDTEEEGIEFFANVPSPFPVGRDERRSFMDAYDRFGEVCRQRQGDLLEHFSTADTARDLDLLRERLGEPEMNYIGVSYGTFLGATYANLFPGKVRSLVLDGNVAPSAWTNGGDPRAGLTTTGFRIGSHTGAADAFEWFLRLCALAGPSNCAFAGESLGETRAKWAELLDRTREAPIPFEGREVGYAGLIHSVANLLDVVPASDTSPGWIATAEILQILYTGGNNAPPPPPVYGAPESQAAVECGDSPNPMQRRRYNRVADIADRAAGVFGAPTVYGDAPCTNWSRQQDTYTGPWNKRTAQPVLVIGNTHDPSTPYSNAIKMVAELRRARLLTVDGFGHTVLLNPSKCALDHVADYLVRGALPPVGAVCRQNEQPFEPPPLTGAVRAPGSPSGEGKRG